MDRVLELFPEEPLVPSAGSQDLAPSRHPHATACMEDRQPGKAP